MSLQLSEIIKLIIQTILRQIEVALKYVSIGFIGAIPAVFVGAGEAAQSSTVVAGSGAPPSWLI